MLQAGEGREDHLQGPGASIYHLGRMLVALVYMELEHGSGQWTGALIDQHVEEMNLKKEHALLCRHKAMSIKGLQYYQGTADQDMAEDIMQDLTEEYIQ